MRGRRPRLVGIGMFGLALLAAPCLQAQEDALGPGLPKDIQIEFEGRFRLTEEGEYVFTGPVTITYQGSRIQADRLSLRDDRYIEAEGNVLIVWEGNHIFGTRMTYDLKTERGVIEDALGQVQNDYLFWAKKAEKIGKETVKIKKAQVTTCTQPKPYWSFAVSSATITINEYARMSNVRVRAAKVPFFYLPYMIWPVKKDRAVGLLLPEFESTRNLGDAISQELFIPLGRSADLTLLGRYYSKAGFGGGGELRFIPNQMGVASLSGFYIDDKVNQAERYRVTYRQTQSFNNGFRMVADVNLVSDFNYFSDFERDLDIVSSPSILTRVEFTRNGPRNSLNVRELRREQLFADGTELVQQTLPEIEWRGSSRRLGKSPFYLTWESSLAAIQQEGIQAGQPIDADYARADFFPVLSMPLSRLPWIELTPVVRYRGSVWTQRQLQVTDPSTGLTTRRIVNDPLTRQLWGVGLDIIGPKLVRIFEGSAKRYKHLIEPRVVYGFQDEFQARDEIILYDEVDLFSGAGNQVAYSLINRVFASRPRLEPTAAARLQDSLPQQRMSGDLSTRNDDQFLPDEPELNVDPSGAEEPVEIASIELRQTRSFDTDLSFADLDQDGTNESTSPYSDVQLIGRYNPTPLLSLNLSSNYQILYNQISSVNVSGNLNNQLTRLRFSVFFQNGLAVNAVNDTQARFTAGFKMLRGKLRLDLDGSIDFDPPEGQRAFPDRRIRLTYASQCCTVILEQIDRAFSGLAARDDFYFRVELTGIGKIFDLSY